MADKSATEILQNTSKAFVGFETALRVARERLEGAAHAEQLAEAATREYLPGKGLAARKQMMTGAASFGNDLRGFLKSGKSPAGGDLTAEERAAGA